MANPSLADVMRLVQEDCERDAAQLDRTPFTPKGVGEALGNTLAMVKAVARACEVLAEKADPPTPTPTPTPTPNAGMLSVQTGTYKAGE